MKCQWIYANSDTALRFRQAITTMPATEKVRHQQALMLDVHHNMPCQLRRRYRSRLWGYVGLLCGYRDKFQQQSDKLRWR